MRNRFFERLALGAVLMANKDDAFRCSYAVRTDRHAFDHKMRQVVKQLAILKGSGFALVCVADDVFRRGRLRCNE